MYMYESITILHPSIRLLIDNKLSELLYFTYSSYYINTGLCICVMLVSVLMYNFD
jgi:hypothetical protein